MSWDINDFSPAAVHNEASERVGERPVAEIPEGCEGCDGCRGDGIYYGAGRVENGVFVGFTGKCYRCGGKGYQTPADVRRNTYYDNRVRRFSVA